MKHRSLPTPPPQHTHTLFWWYEDWCLKQVCVSAELQWTKHKEGVFLEEWGLGVRKGSREPTKLLIPSVLQVTGTDSYWTHKYMPKLYGISIFTTPTRREYYNHATTILQMGKVRPGIITYHVASAWRGWGWESPWEVSTQSRRLSECRNVFISFTHVGTCELIKSWIFMQYYHIHGLS